MRSIAERAEINKGLLHYYFKTKDALLVEVFHETFGELFTALGVAFNADSDLFIKIESTITVYTDFMMRHPELPGFIIHEMSRDSASHVGRMKKAGVTPPVQGFFQSVIQAREAGLIKADVDPGQLILNMISMVLFPVMAKPMVKYMNDLNETSYKELLEVRKKEVSKFIIEAIKA